MHVGDNVRGKIVKTENRKEIRLHRSHLKRTYLLSLKKNLCNGCGLCAEICPMEAIKFTTAETTEGRLIKKPTIHFDVNSCNLCGECAVLCPLNALKMEIDGKELSAVVKNEVFPVLLKEITVDPKKCDIICNLRCQEECPTEAIKVSTETLENGKTLITGVQIMEDSCFYCKQCQLACPLDAIDVKKPFQGTIELNSDLCPSGCTICEDICPTDAIKLENNRISVNPKYCLFCSACQEVCPKEAVEVNRTWIVHSDIKAAAWLTALKKFTSLETVRKELLVKSGKRRTSAVKNRKRLLLFKPEHEKDERVTEFLEILNEYKE
jgi:4Fe-4S ferredoxin